MRFGPYSERLVPYIALTVFIAGAIMWMMGG